MWLYTIHNKKARYCTREIYAKVKSPSFAFHTLTYSLLFSLSFNFSSFGTGYFYAYVKIIQCIKKIISYYYVHVIIICVRIHKLKEYANGWMAASAASASTHHDRTYGMCKKIAQCKIVQIHTHTHLNSI